MKEEADRAAPSLDEWAGAMKEKLAQVPATVIGRMYLPNGNYPSTLTPMRDEQGHTVKWFASNPPDVEEGSEVVIDSATIKALDTYQGTKQTSLTRTKMTVAEDQPAAG